MLAPFWSWNLSTYLDTDWNAYSCIFGTGFIRIFLILRYNHVHCTSPVLQVGTWQLTAILSDAINFHQNHTHTHTHKHSLGMITRPQAGIRMILYGLYTYKHHAPKCLIARREVFTRNVITSFDRSQKHATTTNTSIGSCLIRRYFSTYYQSGPAGNRTHLS